MTFLPETCGRRRSRSLTVTVISFIFAIACGFASEDSRAGETPLPATQPTAGAQITERTILPIILDLASDFSSSSPSEREKLLATLDRRGSLLNAQQARVGDVFSAGPRSDYTLFASPSPDAQLGELLEAAWLSYGRFLGGQADRETDWAAKQFAAAQRLSERAAAALLASAEADERIAAGWTSRSYAARRSAPAQAATLDKIRDSGLSAEHQRLLRASGRSDAEIQALREALLKIAPDKVGMSAIEVMSSFAQARRKGAAVLKAFAKSSPGQVLQDGAHEFTVFNPKDETATINLVVRRAAVPPTWRLAVLDAEERPNNGEGSRVHAIEPGARYSVTLPAKGQLKVASIVQPVGYVGDNMVARWAVEGYVGNELIGGMMHEMHVPASLPNFQLPPPTDSAASAGPLVSAPLATPGTSSGASTQRAPLIRVTLIATTILAIVVVLITFVRKRRRLN